MQTWNSAEKTQRRSPNSLCVLVVGSRLTAESPCPLPPPGQGCGRSDRAGRSARVFERQPSTTNIKSGITSI